MHAPVLDKTHGNIMYHQCLSTVVSDTFYEAIIWFGYRIVTGVVTYLKALGTKVDITKEHYNAAL